MVGDTGRIFGGAEATTPKVDSPPKVASTPKVASGNHLSPGPPDGHGHFGDGDLTFGDHINGGGNQRGEERQKLPDPLSDGPASGRHGPASAGLNGSNARQQGHGATGRFLGDEEVLSLCTIESHRMHLLISFRKATSPQNRQLVVHYY